MKTEYIYWIIGAVVAYFLYTKAQATSVARQQALAAQSGGTIGDMAAAAGIGLGLSFLDDEGF